MTPNAVVSFVDTNILAYAHDASDPVRQPIAERLLDELWRFRSGVLSTQVRSEFYVVATGKFAPPMPRREARAIVDAYAAWPVVQVDPSFDRGRVGIGGAPPAVVLGCAHPAGRRAGARRLMSEDLQTAAHRRSREDPFPTTPSA